MKKYIAVLAGDYMQYKNFMSQKEVGGPCNYIYIDSIEKVFGHRFFNVECLGTFWERKDAHKLYDAVKLHITGLKD